VTETPSSMAEAPAVGPLPAVALPRATRFALSSGLEIVALKRDVAPIVSAAFMFRSGAACDPSGRAGLSSIAAEMLDEGAGATVRSCRYRRRARPSRRRWRSPPTS
jgi:predicted Zn-dependent peptidase